MPVMNEFYVNYGLFGVVLGMFALGTLIRLLVFIISTKNEYNYHFISGFAALFPIFFRISFITSFWISLSNLFIFNNLFYYSKKNY